MFGLTERRPLSATRVGPLAASDVDKSQPMPNAAAVTFTYATEKPTVSSISSSHRVRPEALEALGLPPARGPFAGGTTITVRGSGFLRSGHLRCRFEDDVTGFPPFVVSFFQFSYGRLV